MTENEIMILANAIYDKAFDLDVPSPGGMHSSNICRYCDAWVNWNEPVDDIKHYTDCPYVIAKRFLENTPKKANDDHE
jgi:hypothetical protein